MSRFSASWLVFLVAASAPVGCTPGGTSGRPDADEEPLWIMLRPDDPVWSEHAPESYRARFQTNEGDFVIAVHRSWAPLGADRFYNLVRHGFYDTQRFTRVVEGFIVQWGLSGDPEVSAAWRPAYFEDDPVVHSNVRGAVAYAFTQPGTRSTQIFINLADNTRLDDEGFPPFGEVVEGMEVVDNLYSGYGEEAGGGLRRGDQTPIVEGGNVYLMKEFPELDYIIRAVIE